MRAIDADALLDDVIERYCKDSDRRKGVKRGKWRFIYEIGEVPCRACSVDDMKSEFEDAPTIDAEPVKHGRWVETDRDDPCYYACSLCGKRSDFEENYCPNCGAKMDEVEAKCD